jgi:hypothetical protein
MVDEVINEIESIQESIVDVKHRLRDVIRLYDLDLKTVKDVRVMLSLTLNELDNANMMLQVIIRMLRKARVSSSMSSIKSIEEEEGSKKRVEEEEEEFSTFF